MFATGFSLNVRGIDDAATGATREFLAATARGHGVHVLAGLVTVGPDGRGRNQAALVDPEGREVGRYTKQHLFSFADEHQHYTAGTDLPAWRCAEFAVAPAICYDLRFPELFRAEVAAGAQLFAVVANWPSPRVEHWLTLLRARAIENQAYVIGVNRCGRDPQHPYPGRSQIIDPRGNVLADGGDGEGVIRATAELETVESYRREFPALRDRRA
jgi:omega-amidase